MSESPEPIARDRGIHLFTIEVFLAIVSEQSYAGAARKLKIDERSVRRHLHDLEEWLDKRLLIKKPLRITPDGAEFMQKAQQISRLLFEARYYKSRLREICDRKGGDYNEVIEKSFRQNKVTGTYYFEIE